MADAVPLKEQTMKQDVPLANAAKLPAEELKKIDEEVEQIRQHMILEKTRKYTASSSIELA